MPSKCKTSVFVLVLAQLAATDLWVGWVGAVDWSSQLLSGCLFAFLCVRVLREPWPRDQEGRNEGPGLDGELRG